MTNLSDAIWNKNERYTFLRVSFSLIFVFVVYLLHYLLGRHTLPWVDLFISLLFFQMVQVHMTQSEVLSM